MEISLVFINMLKKMFLGLVFSFASNLLQHIAVSHLVYPIPSL